MLTLHFGDNLPFLKTLPDNSIDLVYIDPPFNTGKQQSLTQLRTEQTTSEGDRVGFGGKKFKTTKLGTQSFKDQFLDYPGFLNPRLEEAYRVLKPIGCLFLHLDYREVHYAKVELDKLFGRSRFMNEIIWAYDYGARSKSKWPAKHDNILWYVKDPKNYTFNYDEIDRVPYMAPGLVGEAKAARGKTLTSVWWHTIVPTMGHERTGYPTQKPLGIINRLIRVHTKSGDMCLDFFAGSGTLGESALRHQRDAILVDDNLSAIRTIQKRLAEYCPKH